MKQIILLADNNKKFREVWGKILTNAGYEVKSAANPQEVRIILISGGIDLAILDVRLEDDDDELDISGLNLATDSTFRHIPKIILTAHKPSPESIRKLRELSVDELPSAVTWIGKDEGTGKLLEIIPKVISLWPRLQKIQILAGKISKRLEDDHDTVRQQATRNYRRAAIFSFIGSGVILAGILFALFNILETDISIVAVAGGIVTNLSSYLFFRRHDIANERMDKYHQELLQTYWLELLLATCEPLPAESQITTSEYIIKAATDNWFLVKSDDK